MKVSIISACHNCRPWLSDCVESVRRQNWENYEHIFLDDCSKDNSYAKLSSWAKADPHLKVIRSDTRLYCGSSYYALSYEATGDIVCVIDSDDAITKNAISKLVEAYEKYPDVDYIWTQFWYCDSNLRKIKRGFSRPPKDGRSVLQSGHCFSHWRTFRRSVLDKGPIFPKGLKSSVDNYMGYSLEELGIGGFLDIPLYKFRQRPGGLSYTGKRNWKKMLKRFAAKRKENNITTFPVKVLSLP